MAKPFDDSPGGIAILLSHKKPDMGAPMEHGDGEEKSDDGLPDGLEAAGQDLLDAIGSGDAKAIAHALHDAWSCCEQSESTDYPASSEAHAE